MEDVPVRNRADTTLRTISVPKAVNEEMKQHRSVNWSAVAARAFRAVLKKLRGKRCA